MKQLIPGVLVDKTGHMLADAANIPACREFISRLRQAAADADLKANAATQYKANLHRQNARAARHDADALEATIPCVLAQG